MVMPMVMRSPSRSGCVAISAPLTSVPFVEPRSVMVQTPWGSKRSSAWVRLALMSWTTMSFFYSRPMSRRAEASE